MSVCVCVYVCVIVYFYCLLSVFSSIKSYNRLNRIDSSDESPHVPRSLARSWARRHCPAQWDVRRNVWPGLMASNSQQQQLCAVCISTGSMQCSTDYPRPKPRPPLPLQWTRWLLLIARQQTTRQMAGISLGWGTCCSSSPPPPCCKL